MTTITKMVFYSRCKNANNPRASYENYLLRNVKKIRQTCKCLSLYKIYTVVIYGIRLLHYFYIVSKRNLRKENPIEFITNCSIKEIKEHNREIITTPTNSQSDGFFFSMVKQSNNIGIRFSCRGVTHDCQKRYPVYYSNLMQTMISVCCYILP